MKHLFYIILIFCLYGCGEPYPEEKLLLHEGQKIAMPKYYRRITGYDSIQIVHYRKGSSLGNGWEGHFCNPNEWEFEKFKSKK